MLPALIIAGVAAAAILFIFMGLAGSRPVDPVQARLTQLGTMQAKNLEELELQQPFMERTLRPLAGRMSGAVGRVTSQSFGDRTQKRLALAGNPGDLGVSDWLGIKGLCTVMFAIGGFFLFYLIMGGFVGGLIGVLVGGLVGYMAPEFWLGRRIKARQKAILMMIPDTLDLLTISVRAGLGFDAALGKVVEKLDGPLSDEFRRALAEVRVGKSRREALRDMIPRTEVQPLTNFIGAIIQAEQLGVSISKVLQVQSEQLRIERRQRAEEMAAKAPIKMLFPLVGLHLPVAVHRHPRAGDHPHRQEPAHLAMSDPDRGARPSVRRAHNLDRETILADAARVGRQPVGPIHGPDGPADPARRERTVAAGRQRHPHDVHALRDRLRVRLAALRRRWVTTGASRSVAPCRPGAGSCGSCAAPTARSSCRSGTIDRTATALGDRIVIEDGPPG